MVNPFTNVRRRPGTETGLPARPRAIGIALASATALAMTSCQSATPSPQASPEPEAWEKVVAEDTLFDDRLTDGVVESLCTTASSTMNRTDPDLPANLEWDGGNYSCGGSVSIPTSSDPVVLTPYLSFSRLNEYEQKSLAQHLLKKDNETSVCILTAFLQSSGEGTQTERETTNGEYCYYPYTGDSYSAYGEGWYVAGNAGISVEFSATDEEADPEEIQEGIDELLDLTMEALLAEYPHT